MRFFLSVGVASLLTGQILAQSPYAITGVRNKNLSLRKNIDDLQNEAGPQWDLYIQALSAMYNADPDDALSHFQIGGIHGRPFVEWNNTGKEVTGSNWRGYCPHGEGLFLSWHRPYVLLFEQALVSQARSIAQTYPDNLRAEYAQAAEELRSPWWDYAISLGVPLATVPQQVSVHTATGRKQVENPLAGFTFPSSAINSGKYGTFMTDPKVRRCSSPGKYPQTANDLLGRFNYRQNVYDVFAKNSVFSMFGSTASKGLSLEQIHNDIHVRATCGEQFSNPHYAGFDPLFMLHHTNVDRLWAYWQAIQPEEGNMRETYTGRGRFTTPENTKVSIDSPLQPFFQNSDSFHTSKSVSSIQNLGYTYETLDFGRKSAAVMKRDATLLVNKLYSANNKGPASSRRDRKARRDVNQEKRFFINVQVDLEELPRPCSLNVYIEKKVVGTMVAMPLPRTGVSNAQLCLDNYVSSDKRAAEQIFAGNVTGIFQFAVAKPDGSLVKTGPIASLNMELEDVDVMPAARKDEFPTYKTNRRTKIENIGEFSP